MMRSAVQLVLAGTVSDPTLRQSIEEDLLDEYEARRAQEGSLAAGRWAAVQLVLSFPDFAGLGAPGAMPLLPQAAGRFYGILLLLVVVGTALAELAIRRAAGAGVVQGLLTLFAVQSLAVLAGYGVAAIAVRASLAGALGLGVVAAAAMLGAIALGIDGPPMWYLAASALLFPPAAFAGGMFRTRRRLASLARRGGVPC